MNLFITSGTRNYLKKMKEKYPEENMLLLGDEESAVLIHETASGTIFNQPRKYEVIDSYGNFENAEYVVMNNIPVTDEGKPLFEYRFKNRNRQIESQPGFVAIRVLRPITSNTYIILTLWENRQAFEKWKTSESFQKSHAQQAGTQTTHPHSIFTGPSYITTYSIAEEE
ncbi:antibiotic biosynthesis monooxygenase [Mesobacillus maritimus]|uniref:antibiotic biosynthesis monooxygenase family protein n=1 Tax=Mesobacillus maritimus TaxID=1643336 RepID=UPI00203C84BF|nr:antibiotic biosynthesis monooxygenase [Mesobacillus maritimus]MCM3586071.1 antibiotic biosynthesis monooxygenase [Mesobacillus maritimus]MCM3667398.1 antibiotic biosynthesis monooxygenase [Mesobacillus maritimus]